MREWTETERQDWADRHVRLGQNGPVFPTQPPDQAWRERFETNHPRRALPASLEGVADEEFRSLVADAKTKLDGILAFGGWAVCHEPMDMDLDRILARGILLDGSRARKIRGRPSDCHKNSAWIWMDRKSTASVMTGYALSDDGMWRVHSWLAALDRSETPRILETTMPRLAYFGFLRSPVETLELIDDKNRFDSPKDRMEDMRTRLLALETELTLSP